VRQENNLQALTSLGLTLVQSRVFLALSKLDSASIKEISELSKVPRQDIYRTISELQELSLAIKLLTKPVKFRATEMEETLAILLKTKKTEFINLKRTQKKFLETFNLEKQIVANKNHQSQFCLIKGKHAIFKIIKEKVLQSNATVEIVTTQHRYLQSITYLGSIYRKKMAEGVVFRVVTEKPIEEKAFLLNIHEIMNYENLVLKYSTNPIEAIAVIFDGEEALVAIEIEEGLLRSPLVHISNPAFLVVFKEYFSKIWNNAVAYDAVSKLPMYEGHSTRKHSE
jgi:sugar-specific transcriptional regulator TrmB